MHDFNAAPSAATAPSPARPHVLEIRFTGSGSEYFRIWAVNLLLILVTLGLYLPFAKARRIRYFYANTLVDGQALSFHGDPWKMFRGFVLLVVLMGVYGAAGQLSATAGLIAFVLLALAWPALWRSGLQFRLANTRWRGLRLGFTGSLAGAYAVFLPAVLPALVIAALGLVQPEGKMAMLLTALLPLVNLLIPLVLARAKQYQHNHYVYASQRSSTSLTVGQVYGTCLLVGLLTGVTFALMGGTLAVLAPGLGASAALGLVPLFVAVGLVAYLAFMAMFTARLQNQVWSSTRSAALQFSSQLSSGALAGLTIKNWLLTALTLGLYRPFAVVETTRLRLHAVSLVSTQDPALWADAGLAAHADATGDAAGDFFGIDMGL
jgi:uncharacterized membrane protein YjgN (DUF898 family)